MRPGRCGAELIVSDVLLFGALEAGAVAVDCILKLSDRCLETIDSLSLLGLQRGDTVGLALEVGLGSKTRSLGVCELTGERFVLVFLLLDQTQQRVGRSALEAADLGVELSKTIVLVACDLLEGVAQRIIEVANETDACTARALQIALDPPGSADRCPCVKVPRPSCCCPGNLPGSGYEPRPAFLPCTAPWPVSTAGRDPATAASASKLTAAFASR